MSNQVLVSPLRSASGFLFSGQRITVLRVDLQQYNMKNSQVNPI